MLRRLPLRWRLTLWYGVLTTVALALFGAALFVGLRLRLYTTFDEQLRDQAVLTRSTVQLKDGALIVNAEEAADPRQTRHFVRLIDLNGAVIADTSSQLGTIPLDPASFRSARDGATQLSSIRVGGGVLRVVTTPVIEAGAVAGVLQVGMSRHEVDESLVGLLASFAIATPLVLLFGAGGGYLLARRALAPVTEITRLADRIGESDLHARLDLDLPNDEVGRLAGTFNAMLARIESAFARQRQFTENAAHELRTPLSLMCSQLDLALARSRTAEEYHEALLIVDGAAKRLTGLVGTLLALTRADSGQPSIHPTRFDLAETISVVLEQYAFTAAPNAAPLRDESAPTTLVADEDLLIQVLVNLIDNALAHTNHDGVVAVGCKAMGERALAWVSDTGSGIAAEHLPNVFDRFYRVERGRDRTRGGAGLGLSICQVIVEAHGGEITMRSTPSRGTTVQFVLPRGPGPGRNRDMLTHPNVETADWAVEEERLAHDEISSGGGKQDGDSDGESFRPEGRAAQREPAVPAG